MLKLQDRFQKLGILPREIALYTPQEISQLDSVHNGIERRFETMLILIFKLNGVLAEKRAQEYLVEGYGRRLKNITRCIENVFQILPPSRTKLLSENELADCCINLHALFVNISGCLDNLAWVINYEKRLELDRKEVGLFHKKTQKFLTTDFKDFLNSPRIKSWHDGHLKDYRDALAHRIPLYIPPYLQDFETGEKFIGSVFKHSFSEEEPNDAMQLHSQILANFTTIEAIFQSFSKDLLLGKDKTLISGLVSLLV